MCFGVPQHMNCLGAAGSAFKEDKEETLAAPSPQSVRTVSGGFSHSCLFSSCLCSATWTHQAPGTARTPSNTLQVIVASTRQQIPYISLTRERSLFCVQPSRVLVAAGGSRALPGQDAPGKGACGRGWRFYRHCNLVYSLF